VRLTTVKIPYSEGDTIKLHPWGDFHLLSASCDTTALFAKREEIINDPLSYFLFMGDGAECITPNDPRWNAGGIDWNILSHGDIDNIPDITKEYLGDFFQPLAQKCVGYHRGNHEASVDKHCQTNISTSVMLNAGISLDLYSEGMAFTRLVFDDGKKHTQSIVINSAHGRQAGEQDGAKINKMKRALSYFRCDILVRGHSHSLFTSPSEWLCPNESHTKLVTHRGYVGHTGSYMRAYEHDTTCYAEVADYPPTTIGCPVFLITPSRYNPIQIRAMA